MAVMYAPNKWSSGSGKLSTGSRIAKIAREIGLDIKCAYLRYLDVDHDG
jgi:hypothetical protein